MAAMPELVIMAASAPCSAAIFAFSDSCAGVLLQRAYLTGMSIREPALTSALVSLLQRSPTLLHHDVL